MAVSLRNLVYKRHKIGIEDGIVVKSHEIHSETDVGLLTHFLSSSPIFYVSLDKGSDRFIGSDSLSVVHGIITAEKEFMNLSKP